METSMMMQINFHEAPGFFQPMDPFVAMVYIYIWWFPEIGLRPNHPFFVAFFPHKNQENVGVPPWLWKPQMV